MPSLQRIFALAQGMEQRPELATEVRNPVEARITRATTPRLNASERDLLSKLAVHAALQRACCICGAVRGARGIRHVADCALMAYVAVPMNGIVIQPGEET